MIAHRRALTLAAVLVALTASACDSGRDRERAGVAEREPTTEAPPGSPNVVVVMTDDQAVATMRAMPLTRKLIGERGVTFDASATSFPLCCPSRATFLTGRYAHNHDVRDNSAPAGGLGKLDQSETLPVWLARAGYRSAFVGKYLNGYGKDELGGPEFIPPGWTEWYGLGSKDKRDVYDYEMNVNGEMRSFGSAEEDFKTDVLARFAKRFVREQTAEGKPFFLWVATPAPHGDFSLSDGVERNPIPAPRHHGMHEGERAPRGPSFDEADVSDKPRFVRKLKRLGPRQRAAIDLGWVSQLESLHAVDELVAGIVRELRRAGELRNTLLIFTSDNGFLHGQHRFDSGKSKLYEESILVPLLVRGPGFPAGVRTDNPVVNADLAATILELTGAHPNEPVDGVPLTRALEPAGAKRAVLLEVFERKADQFTGLRTRRYAYAEREGDINELYDLKRDPYQLENVISDPAYAQVRRKLAGRLEQLRSCEGETCH